MMSDWEILETVGTEQEARLIAGFLESREVPVNIEALVFRQEPVTFGGLSQIRLRVPANFVAEARRLLEARRHRFTIIEGEARKAAGGAVTSGEQERELDDLAQEDES